MNNFIKLYEETYNDLLGGQSSIYGLFPNFDDRVKAVAARGGVKMVDMMPDTWHFKVNSGTKEGVRYDVYFKFKNMIEVLTKWVFNQNMWVSNKEHVDYRKLAAEVLNEVDFELSCSDPSFLYYGGAYILTKKDAKYGDKENRAPNVRNPKQRGTYVCKHIQLAMQVLPFYVSTFSKFLQKYWKSEIEEIEQLYKSEILAGEEENEEIPSSTGVTPTEAPETSEIPAKSAQGEEIPVKTSKSAPKPKNPLKTQANTKIEKASIKASKPATQKYKGDYNVG